jgi:hypothetical protein
MAQKKTTEILGTTQVPGTLRVAEGVTLEDALRVTGAATFSSTVTVSGTTTLNTFKLVQTLGGTDVITGRWVAASTPPALTVGNFFFTFTSGASTFRVPCFPTT